MNPSLSWRKDVLLNDNLYPGLDISGVIDPIIGPNISAVQTSQPIIGRRLPVAAARRVEARFEESSVNNSLVIANIGDSVALHCNIWMKQVQEEAECFILIGRGPSRLCFDWLRSWCFYASLSLMP